MPHNISDKDIILHRVMYPYCLIHIGLCDQIATQSDMKRFCDGRSQYFRGEQQVPVNIITTSEQKRVILMIDFIFYSSVCMAGFQRVSDFSFSEVLAGTIVAQKIIDKKIINLNTLLFLRGLRSCRTSYSIARIMAFSSAQHMKNNSLKRYLEYRGRPLIPPSRRVGSSSENIVIKSAKNLCLRSDIVLIIVITPPMAPLTSVTVEIREVSFNCI